jgi:hypothetical protein
MSAFGRLFTRSRIEGLIILLVAAGYLWEGHNVPEFYKLPGVPGPTVFPLLLGVVFALSGLWLVVAPPDRKVEADTTPAGETAESLGGSTPPVRSRGRIVAYWHTCVMWGVILVYLYVMPDLGFPVATALLLVAFFLLLGETRWHVVIGLALVTTLVIHLGFALGLNVRLPPGILQPLLK